MCENKFDDVMDGLDERIPGGLTGMDSIDQAFALSLLAEGVRKAQEEPPPQAIWLE